MRPLTHRTLFLWVSSISLLLLSVVATPLQNSRPESLAGFSSPSLERSLINVSNGPGSISAPEERSLAIPPPKTDFYHPHVRPEHFRRHRAAMSQIRSLHPGLAERNLLLQFSVYGFQLLWQHMDIAFVTTMAHYRTTTYYQELIRQLPHGEWREGPTVQNIVITYGVFKLMLTLQGFSHELPLGFVEAFAALMLNLSKTIILVTYLIVAFTAEAVIWITLALTAGHEQDIVGRSALGVES